MLEKGMLAVLFWFISMSFKVNVNSITRGPVSETEQESYHYHLGGDIS